MVGVISSTGDSHPRAAVHAGRTTEVRLKPDPSVSAVFLLAVAGGCGGSGDAAEPSTEAAGAAARWSELERRADERGVVPVIVTLELEFVPEGELPPAERAAQQQRIADTRRALFEELAGTRFENVTSFAPVPQVTMDVGPDAVDVLRRSAHVRAVVEDVPRSLD